MTFKVVTKKLSQRKSYKKILTDLLAGLTINDRIVSIVIPIILWIFSQFCIFNVKLYGSTPVGRIITNTVTASFSNATGSVKKTISATNIYSTNSTLSIKKLVKVTNYITYISPTNYITVRQGQNAVFPHSIFNTSNITNNLILTATNKLGYSMSFYKDNNGNGQLDVSDTKISNIKIPPRSSVSILLVENIPITLQQSVYTDTIKVGGIQTGFTNFNNVTGFTVVRTMDYAIITPQNNKIIYLFATDGLHNATKFDGTEELGDLDVTVYMKLLYPSITGIVNMYYDANKLPDGASTKNTTDVKVQMKKQNDFWVGIIPNTDPRIIDNAEIQLIFETDGQKFYRTITPSTQAYSYFVRTYQYKENGNLLNSICYPYDNTKPQPTILFNLDKPSHVIIEVWDLKGEKVRTLLNKECPQGSFEPVKWDGRNDDGEVVGVGLYFITLKYDNIKEVFKVVVIK